MRGWGHLRRGPPGPLVGKISQIYIINMSSTKVLREKDASMHRLSSFFVSLKIHLKQMTVNELKAELERLNVPFNSGALKSELEALLATAKQAADADTGASTNQTADTTVSDELLKLITESGGQSFSSAELQAELQSDLEAEYPDFGRDIPDGAYHITGYATLHQWRSRRTGNISNIRTAFLDKLDADGKPYELPFAAFSANEFPFVKADGTEFVPATILPHFDSVARRNLAITSLAPMTKVVVHHARGHHKNPYAKRVFDFVYTYASMK